MANNKPINYTREAFFHPANLAFLVVTLLIVFFTSGPGYWDEALLLFMTAVELLYLGTVPNMPRFRKIVRARKLAEQKQPPSDQDIFRQLSRLSQKRYLKLRKIQRSIAANYQRFTPTSQGLLENHLKKIDHLIKIYLNLLALKERHEHFLQSTTEENIAQTITALKEDMADDPPRIRAIKERRLEILQKRLNRIKKARENLEILEAQLATIEDVIQYIHDQSLTMRNPEELTFQLDTLLSEAEETEAIVQELEDIFSSTPTLQDTWEEISSGDLPSEGTSSSSSPIRHKTDS